MTAAGRAPYASDLDDTADAELRVRSGQTIASAEAHQIAFHKLGRHQAFASSMSFTESGACCRSYSAESAACCRSYSAESGARCRSYSAESAALSMRDSAHSTSSFSSRARTRVAAVGGAPSGHSRLKMSSCSEQAAFSVLTVMRSISKPGFVGISRIPRRRPADAACRAPWPAHAGLRVRSAGPQQHAEPSYPPQWHVGHRQGRSQRHRFLAQAEHPHHVLDALPFDVVPSGISLWL